MYETLKLTERRSDEESELGWSALATVLLPEEAWPSDQLRDVVHLGHFVKEGGEHGDGYRPLADALTPIVWMKLEVRPELPRLPDPLVLGC